MLPDARSECADNLPFHDREACLENPSKIRTFVLGERSEHANCLDDRHTDSSNLSVIIFSDRNCKAYSHTRFPQALDRFWSF